MTRSPPAGICGILVGDELTKQVMAAGLSKEVSGHPGRGDWIGLAFHISLDNCVQDEENIAKYNIDFISVLKLQNLPS